MLTYSSKGNSQTKSCPLLPKRNVHSPDSLVNLTKSILPLNIFPLKHLGLSVCSFVKEDVRMHSIDTFFSKVVPTSVSASDSVPNTDPSPNHVLTPTVVDASSNNSSQTSTGLYKFFKPRATLSAETLETITQHTSEVDAQENDTSHMHAIDNEIYQCKKCKNWLNNDEKSIAEHLDYHMALDLQRETSTISDSPSENAHISIKTNKKRKRDTKTAVTNRNQNLISKFFQ